MKPDSIVDLSTLAGMTEPQLEVIEDHVQRAYTEGVKDGKAASETWEKTTGRLKGFVVRVGLIVCAILLINPIGQALNKTDFNDESWDWLWRGVSQEEVETQAFGDFDDFYRVKTCPHCEHVHAYWSTVESGKWIGHSEALKSGLCQRCGNTVTDQNETVAAWFLTTEFLGTGQYVLKKDLTDAHWDKIGGRPIEPKQPQHFDDELERADYETILEEAQ